MSNPLEQAIKDAVSANVRIGRIFAGIGNSNHPRGVVPTAYRNAIRGMRSALKERNRTQAMNKVITGLRNSLRIGLLPYLSKSIEFGEAYARDQLKTYGKEADVLIYPKHDAAPALDAVTAVIDKQVAAVKTAITLGMDDALIIGDGERLGIIRPGEIIASATFWAASLVWSAFEDIILLSDKQNTFKKIAVAALDNRTTDCCLRVHGQIQPFNKPFELDGTPRFADKLDWTPFHHYCRTAIALYLPEYDDGISQGLQDSARTVLDERSQGVRTERKPADAYE